MKRKNIIENSFVNNLTCFKKLVTGVIEENYTPTLAIHELLQNGREHGNGKMFKVNINPETNTMVYHDDGKNWTLEKIKSFLETYIFHDTSTIDNNKFLGNCAQRGSGLKNALIYMASQKEPSKVIFYFTTIDSEVYTCEMLIDKSHPEKEYVTEIVEATNLQNIEFGMTIIQDNIRSLNNAKCDNKKDKDKYVFVKNLVSDISTSCRVDKTMKVYINDEPVYFHEPMHTDRLFKLAHVNNEIELENGFYNDEAVLFSVIKGQIIKKVEYIDDGEKNEPIDFMLIPSLLNIPFIEKKKLPDFKYDIGNFEDMQGLYVGIGDSWIERGGNMSKHIRNTDGHFSARFRMALILNNNGFNAFGGKSCKMAGIDPISLDSSFINTHYDVVLSTIPERYNLEGNKKFHNFIVSVRHDFATQYTSFAAFAEKKYPKIYEDGYPESLSSDIFNSFFTNGEKRCIRVIKPKPSKTQIKENLEAKTVEKIPIDQATVPNFIVKENQKPVKVDQKSMLYNMYDENGIILRSLDIYGKPVYTPTEHFPIGSSPLDIITNVYDYIIDSGLMTPEEVKTMNVSLVSSFES